MKTIHDFWLKTFAKYSNLCITKHSDRPIALAGLINSLKSSSNRLCRHGIWIEDLPRALLWSADQLGVNQDLRLSDVPTWSWMSRVSRFGSCGMSYDWVLRWGFHQDPNTSVFPVVPQKEDDSSSSEKACPQSIIFRGRALFGRKVIVREQVIGPEERLFCYDVQIGPDFVPNSSAYQSILIADCPNTPEDLLRDGDLVGCLLFGTSSMGTFQFILVVKICSEEGEEAPMSCRRVGICFRGMAMVEGVLPNHFEKAEIMTLRII